MIGISEIASYIPAQSESNLDKRELFGIDAEFIRNKLGVVQVPRKAPDEDTSDLCAKAFAALRAKLGPAASDIDCLVVCTQNPDGRGIPHTAALVQAKIGAPEACAAFDISLGCSGYVYGLSVVTAFMQANGMRRGLLFTADPYSKIIDPHDKNTVLLFGDAAAVTLLEGGGTDAGRRFYPTRFAFATRGRDGMALNNAAGKLEMNGRAVFSFSATAVPAQVKALLGAAGLTERDVDLFLFHQGSKYIVDTLVQRLALPAGKVPIELDRCGNTVSSSIPLMLEERLPLPELKRVVLSGFGVGLSWASCILERRSNG